eukprot:304835-Pleurochrysis_carterae.AAC.1
MQAAASGADIMFTRSGWLGYASGDAPNVQTAYAVKGENQAPPLGRRRREWILHQRNGIRWKMPPKEH